jgi:hypothetical protein
MSNLEQAAFDESQLVTSSDLNLVRSITDTAQQEVVACSLIKHRRPDKLFVGDPVPALDLTDLSGEDSTKKVNLAAVNDQPLVLIFGSYS